MSPFRPFLAAAAAALSVAAGTASAAPPVGCYGVPTASPLVCVVSFTPENALPDGSGGTRQVAVVTYGGQTYSVVIRDMPAIPPDGPVGPAPGQCRDYRGPSSPAEPYVCAGIYDEDGIAVGVGTCATADCIVLELPVGGLAQAILDRVEDLPICRSRPC